MLRAASLEVSPHLLARHYIHEILQEREEREALREVVANCHRQLVKTREDLAMVAEALLIKAGGVSAEKAHEWVLEVFK